MVPGTIASVPLGSSNSDNNHGDRDLRLEFEYASERWDALAMWVNQEMAFATANSNTTAAEGVGDRGDMSDLGPGLDLDLDLDLDAVSRGELGYEDDIPTPLASVRNASPISDCHHCNHHQHHRYHIHYLRPLTSLSTSTTHTTTTTSSSSHDSCCGYSGGGGDRGWCTPLPPEKLFYNPLTDPDAPEALKALVRRGALERKRRSGDAGGRRSATPPSLLSMSMSMPLQSPSSLQSQSKQSEQKRRSAPGNKDPRVLSGVQQHRRSHSASSRALEPSPLLGIQTAGRFYDGARSGREGVEHDSERESEGDDAKEARRRRGGRHGGEGLAGTRTAPPLMHPSAMHPSHSPFPLPSFPPPSPTSSHSAPPTPALTTTSASASPQTSLRDSLHASVPPPLILFENEPPVPVLAPAQQQQMPTQTQQTPRRSNSSKQRTASAPAPHPTSKSKPQSKSQSKPQSKSKPQPQPQSALSRLLSRLLHSARRLHILHPHARRPQRAIITARDFPAHALDEAVLRAWLERAACARVVGPVRLVANRNAVYPEWHVVLRGVCKFSEIFNIPKNARIRVPGIGLLTVEWVAPGVDIATVSPNLRFNMNLTDDDAEQEVDQEEDRECRGEEDASRGGPDPDSTVTARPGGVRRSNSTATSNTARTRTRSRTRSLPRRIYERSVRGVL